MTKEEIIKTEEEADLRVAEQAALQGANQCHQKTN